MTEIEQLKQKKNQEFLEYEKKYAGTVGESVKVAQIETDKQLIQIEKQYQKSKQAVIEKLLDTVADCKPQVHQNAKQLRV